MGKQADLLKDSDADSNSIARLARETAAEIIGNLGDDPQVLADFGPYDCTEGDYLVLEDELGREPTDAEKEEFERQIRLLLATGSDPSITTHAGLRVVEYGKGRYVVEVRVTDEPGYRSVKVLCAPGLLRIAEGLAWNVGESLGWKMHGGGSSGFGGPVDGTQTGNGRWHVTASAYPAPKTAPARRRAPKVHRYSGNRVDVALRDHETTDDVFWSERCNSYVLVGAAGGDRDRLMCSVKGVGVSLVSVNGGGEVRWTVSQSQIDYAVEAEARGIRGGDAEEQLAAARHFGLVPGRPGETTQPCFGR